MAADFPTETPFRCVPAHLHPWYIDSLLQRLRKSGVGCYIGRVFTVVLIAPTSNAMRIMLKICERFASEFSVIFKASKSMCMLVSKYGLSRCRLLASVNEVPFCLDGDVLPFVDKCCHLGLHVLTTEMTF